MNEEAPLLHGSLQSLHYCHHYSHDPMMSISHTMSSFPHTSGGNLSTLKTFHLALHGLNHIHTSYSYHISITFDLHNCIFTKMVQIIISYYGLPLLSPKKGSKTLKGFKNPKKEKGPKNHRKIPWIKKYHGLPHWVQKP